MRTARYGWIRQLPDHRDIPRMATRSEYPMRADLRAMFPAVWDQGQLGSCTGHACAAALAYGRATEDLAAVTPSRLMLYYNARSIEGTQDWDSGAQIRDVIKGAAKFGACSEELWPYAPDRFNVPPSAEAYRAADKTRAVGYRRVGQQLWQLCEAISSGSPVVFGFSVYDSFESEQTARTGIMGMPAPSEALVGGHAVIAVGYDLEQGHFIIRNSWSDRWGDAGHFYMPVEYITNPDLASDFWTVDLVTYDKP